MVEITHPIDREATLVDLRATVARLQRGSAAIHAGSVPLCCPIDRALPGGDTSEGGWSTGKPRLPLTDRIASIIPLS